MTKHNPNPVFRNRKGIYTHLDATQSLVCDERWQWVSVGADFCEFDNECTRPAPFAEPRRDALTWTLRLGADGGWAPDTLAIHASTGKREARVSWASRNCDDIAAFCWQHGSDVKRSERLWGANHALGFRSGFCMTALLHGLPPDDGIVIDLVWINTLSFAPAPARLRVTRLGWSERQTHFGLRALEGFALACDAPQDEEMDALLNGQAWRDEAGIAHAWLGADGSAIRLTGVN